MRKLLIVLSFLIVLVGLLLPDNNGTKEPIRGTKEPVNGTVATKEAKTPKTTLLTEEPVVVKLSDTTKKIALTMLDKPIADFLTATESIVITDQEEAKTATGKIKITYKYQDNSELTVICSTSSTQLIIYSIIE